MASHSSRSLGIDPDHPSALDLPTGFQHSPMMIPSLPKLKASPRISRFSGYVFQNGIDTCGFRERLLRVESQSEHPRRIKSQTAAIVSQLASLVSADLLE